MTPEQANLFTAIGVSKPTKTAQLTLM